jgi:hypothetical protein
MPFWLQKVIQKWLLRTIDNLHANSTSIKLKKHLPLARGSVNGGVPWI